MLQIKFVWGLCKYIAHFMLCTVLDIYIYIDFVVLYLLRLKRNSPDNISCRISMLNIVKIIYFGDNVCRQTLLPLIALSFHAFAQSKE
jgi:hypothetical protein